MDYETIKVTSSGHITRFMLNRPQVLNAIDQQMHDELQAAFDAFQADEEQWLGVVSGAGERAFSAGSDLKSIAKRGKPHEYPRSGYAGLIERYDLDKPLIAAVDGVAAGGGFEVALACDIIVATRRSRFGLPEPLVGAVALGAGMHRLARQVGLKQAMGMILTGDLVPAEEGHRLGFVTDLVADDAIEQAVDGWCERILRCAPLSIRASKATVMRGLDEDGVAAAMAAQANYPEFDAWYKSADRQEGAEAFAEKRPPDWRGC